MTALEEWRPVFGWEETYEISSAGTVRRTSPGKGTRVGHILKSRLDHRGYLFVSLPGKHCARIHRLLAQTFLGDIPGQLVRHLDGNPLNNRLENLAWGTAQDNTDDRKAHGRKSGWHHLETHCVHGHEYTPENTGVSRRPGFDPVRRCRTCHRSRQRAAYASKRAIETAS